MRKITEAKGGPNAGNPYREIAAGAGDAYELAAGEHTLVIRLRDDQFRRDYSVWLPVHWLTAEPVHYPADTRMQHRPVKRAQSVGVTASIRGRVATVSAAGWEGTLVSVEGYRG